MPEAGAGWRFALTKVFPAFAKLLIWSIKSRLVIQLDDDRRFLEIIVVATAAEVAEIRHAAVVEEVPEDFGFRIRKGGPR